MKKLKLFFVLVMGLTIPHVNAQLIEEDGTEVLDEERGKPLFRLQADEAVYSYEPRDGWYKIRKEVYVDPAQVVDDETILADTELKDKRGNTIGKVLREMKLVEGKREESFRGQESYRAILEGYLFKTKFKDQSSPEEKLSKILEMKNRTDQQEEFKELFNTYDFEERGFDEFTVRAYREENKTLADEKDFRMIIVFRGEETPYAVISKDHNNVTAPKIKMESGEDPFRIIYFYKPPARQQELIEDEILYTYLAL